MDFCDFFFFLNKWLPGVWFQEKDASWDSISEKTMTGWHYPLGQGTLHSRPGCLRLSEKHPVHTIPHLSGHMSMRCPSWVFAEPKDEVAFLSLLLRGLPFFEWRMKEFWKPEGLPEFLENMKLFWRTNSFHAFLRHVMPPQGAGNNDCHCSVGCRRRKESSWCGNRISLFLEMRKQGPEKGSPLPSHSEFVCMAQDKA